MGRCHLVAWRCVTCCPSEECGSCAALLYWWRVWSERRERESTHHNHSNITWENQMQIIVHLANPLSRATISWRVSWKPLDGLFSGRFLISFSENRILRAVPRPCVWWDVSVQWLTLLIIINSDVWGRDVSVYLQFPPESTFTAAHTVHDTRDVLKMKTKLFLKHKTDDTQPMLKSLSYSSDIFHHLINSYPPTPQQILIKQIKPV